MNMKKFLEGIGISIMLLIITVVVIGILVSTYLGASAIFTRIIGEGSQNEATVSCLSIISTAIVWGCVAMGMAVAFDSKEEKNDTTKENSTKKSK